MKKSQLKLIIKENIQQEIAKLKGDSSEKQFAQAQSLHKIAEASIKAYENLAKLAEKEGLDGEVKRYRKMCEEKRALCEKLKNKMNVLNEKSSTGKKVKPTKKKIEKDEV
jgi:flagellar biosynthesis/type III secretory pathway protein FliH